MVLIRAVHHLLQKMKKLQDAAKCAQMFQNMAVCQNLVPLVNIKIAGKWMFIPLKMVCIGIDPYPYHLWILVPRIHDTATFLPFTDIGSKQHPVRALYSRPIAPMPHPLSFSMVIILSLPQYVLWGVELRGFRYCMCLGVTQSKKLHGGGQRSNHRDLHH